MHYTLYTIYYLPAPRLYSTARYIILDISIISYYSISISISSRVVVLVLVL